MSSLEIDRERVIQSLCAHFANDQLTTQELEARLDRAYQAANATELQALTSNLPALPAELAPPRAPTVAQRARTLIGNVATVKRSLALMSEVVKAGEWIPARKNVMHVVMGTATIDLREALLSPGETEFELNALMGEIKVIVPPGLRVACDGLAIMAEFRAYDSAGSDDPHAPLVLIHGMAVMSSVTVQTRLPGETGRDARRRQRLDRREETE
jgi:hypothetical protein